MEEIQSLSLHQPVPGFILPDLEDRLHSLSEVRGRIAVINFWSAECPWAERVDRQLLPWLEQWGEAVSLVPVAANANESLDLLKRVAGERGLRLVLRDPRHEVADLYAAVTTPHLFLMDGEGLLRYQGAFDDVTFRQRVSTRFYLKEAVDALLQGRSPKVEQTTPSGCTIVRQDF